MCFDSRLVLRPPAAATWAAPSPLRLGPVPERGGFLGGRLSGRLSRGGPSTFCHLSSIVEREPEAYGEEKFAHFGFYRSRVNYHEEDTTDVYAAWPLPLFLLLFPPPGFCFSYLERLSFAWKRAEEENGHILVVPVGRAREGGQRRRKERKGWGGDTGKAYPREAQHFGESPALRIEIGQRRCPRAAHDVPSLIHRLEVCCAFQEGRLPCSFLLPLSLGFVGVGHERGTPASPRRETGRKSQPCGLASGPDTW